MVSPGLIGKISSPYLSRPLPDRTWKSSSSRMWKWNGHPTRCGGSRLTFMVRAPPLATM